MKKSLLYSAVFCIIALMAFSSCGTEEQTPHTSFTASLLPSYSGDAVTTSFSVIADDNMSWEIVEKQPNLGWVRIEPMSGMGTTEISLTLSRNNSDLSRSLPIDLISGDLVRSLEVIQNNFIELSVTGNSAAIDGNTGDRVDVAIALNNEGISWSMTSLPNWITSSMTGTSGRGSRTITLTVHPNDSRNLRTHEFTFSAGTGSNRVTRTFVVTQSGAAVQSNLTPASCVGTWYIASEMAVKIVEGNATYTSVTPYTVTIAEDTGTPGEFIISGLGKAKISFIENGSTVERDFTATVRATGGIFGSEVYLIIEEQNLTPLWGDRETTIFNVTDDNGNPVDCILRLSPTGTVITFDEVGQHLITYRIAGTKDGLNKMLARRSNTVLTKRYN